MKFFFLLFSKYRRKRFVVGKIIWFHEFVTTPLLIIFYSFYLFVNNNLIFFYIATAKKVEKCWFYRVSENKVRTFIGQITVGGRQSYDNTWVKKRTNVGWPENQRKSGLWAKKKAYLGKEKGIYWSYICPLNKKWGLILWHFS